MEDAVNDGVESIIFAEGDLLTFRISVRSPSEEWGTHHLVKDLTQAWVENERVLEAYILKVEEDFEAVHDDAFLLLEQTVGGSHVCHDEMSCDTKWNESSGYLPEKIKGAPGQRTDEPGHWSRIEVIGSGSTRHAISIIGYCSLQPECPPKNFGKFWEDMKIVF